MARSRKYFYPQIVLTCMDKLEEQIQGSEEEKLDDLEKE